MESNNMSHQTLKEEIIEEFERLIDNQNKIDIQRLDYAFTDEVKHFIDQIIDRTTTHVLSQVEEVLESIKKTDDEVDDNDDGERDYNRGVRDAQEAIKLIK